MTPKYFDIHSHIQFPQFDEDRADVLKRMKDDGVFTIVVGTDKESSQRACDMISLENGIFAAVGLHPNDVLKEEFDSAHYRSLASKEGVVAIGECGLDLFRTKEWNKTELEKQKEVFEQHVELAVELNKPLMIHCRDAHRELTAILQEKKKIYREKLRGNIHFFTGSLTEAQAYVDLGFTISFPGVITFTSDYDDVVRAIPLEQIMSETDCPFAAPVPYRGKRNEPVYVKEVVKRIAEIRGEDFESVREVLVSSALKMFGI